MRSLSLLACVLLSACTSGVRPSPPDASALSARLGSAGCVTASLLVRIVPVPEADDGEVFTLRIWSPPDGRVRVSAHKLDVDFLSALVMNDGSYTAVLPRERVWARGRLGGAADPVLLRDLALLVAEVRHGPLPASVAVVQGADRTLEFVDPGTGWKAVLGIGANGLPVGKRLLAADGSEQRRLTYEHWQGFDGLLRPTVVGLVVAGDPATGTIRLKTLDTPPTISDERMQLHLPESAIEVTPDELARRLGG